MRIAVVLSLLFAWLAPAAATEIVQCGGASASLTFHRPDPRAEGKETVLTVTRGKRKVSLRFDAIDFIGAECRKSIVGKPYIVFQAYCGGSACRDLDNYGIVDPSNLVIVMEPNDWNRDDAARFLGTEAIPVHDIYSVDTGKRIYDGSTGK